MHPPTEEVPDERHPGTPRLLHVLNGDATAHKLRHSGVPGTLAVWADVLHEGPVPPDDSMEEWLRVRARFIAGCGWASFEEALRRHREWQSVLETFREYDEVVLWFEHDLFDQLLLVRHLDWFDRQEMNGTKLSLICIGSYPGVEDFVGLGQLSPDQLASLLDTRRPVTSRQTRLAREAWRAFTSPDPLRIERLLRGDTSALPFLEGALWRFLQEYPSVRGGLPRTERQLLEALAGGPLTPVALFHENQRREERIFMGDSTVWLRVRGLAGGPAPLAEMEVGEAGTQLPEGTVRLTPAGRAVLEGREDWVRLGGVDRWLGGVHLHGGEVRWRWDDASGGLVNADGATA
ncbi:MAG TPA: hypothetical protein VHG28_14450 [Longimicrobiaceae bacterium]|nr:hypothetical protein [Longimicrobiaceae bacterium]